MMNGICEVMVLSEPVEKKLRGYIERNRKDIVNLMFLETTYEIAILNYNYLAKTYVRGSKVSLRKRLEQIEEIYMLKYKVRLKMAYKNAKFKKQ